jgi:UV DNA damage endonuclease
MQEVIMAIGYACITLGAPGTAMHACTARNADKTALHRITGQNLAALAQVIDYNCQNGILLYRISSDLIPFASHPLNNQTWQDDFKKKLSEIGARIRDSDMRVSMHPGQYTVLNSPNPVVVSRAIEDLIYHDRLLSALDLDGQHKIILHVGGVYGDKPSATARFKSVYAGLSESIRGRLVLENDERCFSAEEVLAIAEELGIPAVYDNLHNQINPSVNKWDDKTWIALFAKTWRSGDGRQKIHYAQQDQAGRRGAHASTIRLAEFLEFYRSISDSAPDIMLEVKDKNLSALKCSYAAQPEGMPKMGLEKEWARYKYAVLSRSAQIYHQMTELMKQDGRSAVKDFYSLVEAAFDLMPNAGAEENAALHVWGYFKDRCTEQEKKTFFSKLEKAKTDMAFKAVKRLLLRLAQRYEVDYLLNAYYFIDSN